MDSKLPERFAILQLSHCPLLALPGELRNRIYDYCVETEPIALPPAIHQLAPSYPRFGGLRHASKTLHTEFTPLYLERTIISIHHSEVERYLSAVYPKQQQLSHRENLVRRLRPNIHGHVRINIRHGDVLDLTPFAGLAARAPNIHLEFACKAATYPVLRGITELLRAITSNSNSIDFEHVVERILFRCSLGSQVVVKLHRDVLLKTLFEDARHSMPRHWFVRQSLPALNHIELVMEFSEGVLREPPTRLVWPHTFANRRVKVYRGPTRFVRLHDVEMGPSSLRSKD